MENLWIVVIVLIVAAAVWLIVMRKNVKEVDIDAKNKKANIKAHGPGGVNISGIKMTGDEHEVSVSRDRVDVREVEMDGKGHKVSIGNEK